ncbi:MAG TPA: mechanosensitive ion channel family protein [Gemmataceae bacterium]|nr:mechanosensitive ion channel family protein [Gemmataceae bacterium]
MEFLSSFTDLFADDRLAANLIVGHGIITILIVVSLLLRRVVVGSSSPSRSHPAPPDDPAEGRLRGWLAAAGEEATRRAGALLFWLTVILVMLTAVGGVGYHLAGRDIRLDLSTWYERLTVTELLAAAVATAKLLTLALGAWFAVRCVRRMGPALEAQMRAAAGVPANGETVHQWFLLLQRYATVVIRLLALGAACRVVGLGELTDPAMAFLLRMLTILVVARLLILSCRVGLQTVTGLGDRYLQTGPFRPYWERVTRLFPFGERCFEAAVYVTAASMGVRALHFIAGVVDFGPKLVQCIGIFFTTRVLIELLQVLLCEAFGHYRDAENTDQKGRTLVPLLHSVSQYVLYFGSAMIMLDVLGIDTRPILAGAGIVGLAVGLGSQSLVTDVVSGFFILFENQYLVGDFVQVGDATGTVEAVGIRVTHIRDQQGKLHIIPNGAIKGVVSYSKEYINAVVDFQVPFGSDLEATFRAMTEAGQRLRQLHREVLAETQIQGLVELGTSAMTIRAVTRVRPGNHLAMENEYRRLLKQVLDQTSRVAQAA